MNAREGTEVVSSVSYGEIEVMRCCRQVRLWPKKELFRREREIVEPRTNKRFLLLQKMALSYELVGSSTSDTSRHISQRYHSLTSIQANNLLGTHDLNTRLRVGASSVHLYLRKRRLWIRHHHSLDKSTRLMINPTLIRSSSSSSSPDSSVYVSASGFGNGSATKLRLETFEQAECYLAVSADGVDFNLMAEEYESPVIYGNQCV
ncbi:hypothetical protein Bca4012_064854 [Brassica carinata]